MQFNIIIIVLLFIPFYIIAAAIHEIGHILVGIKGGFKFFMLVVGPFGLKRNENDKIVFYIEKKVAFWGGVGGTLPKNENKDNFNKFSNVLLGGPLFSIFFGLVFVFIGVNFNNLYFLTLGAMCVGMGAACLIPMRNGAFYTDGGRWLRMRKDSSTKDIEMAIWNITQQAFIFGDFTHSDINDIDILKNSDDMRTKYIGHYYSYNYYKDNRNCDEAEKEKEMLIRLKDKVSKQITKMFTID